jgi:hypothetical protein
MMARVAVSLTIEQVLLERKNYSQSEKLLNFASTGRHNEGARAVD